MRVYERLIGTCDYGVLFRIMGSIRAHKDG